MRPARRSQRGSPSPYAAALRLLARRDLPEQQLRVRLDRHGYTADSLDAALDRLRADGLLDDRRFARAYARTAARVKRRGRLRIVRELEALGVAPDTVRTAVQEVMADLDETALLEQTLARRLRGRPLDAPTLHRLHRYLLRQGFASERIGAALRALRRSQQRDPD